MNFRTSCDMHSVRGCSTIGSEIDGIESLDDFKFQRSDDNDDNVSQEIRQTVLGRVN